MHLGTMGNLAHNESDENHTDIRIHRIGGHPPALLLLLWTYGRAPPSDDVGLGETRGSANA